MNRRWLAGAAQGTRTPAILRPAQAWMLVVVWGALAGCQNGAPAEPARSRQDPVLEARWPELPRLGFQALSLQRHGESLQPALPIPRENASHLAQVKLPTTSGAPFEVREGPMAIRVTLRHQERVPGLVRGDSVLFPKGWRGSDVVLRALADGVEDFITLDGSLPPAVDYEVELEGVEGVRLVSETLEFLTRDGDPKLRMSPPVVLSKGRRVPVQVTVTGCAHDTSPRAPWGRPVTPPGAARCAVHLAWDLAAEGYPALLDPAWVTTGDLATGRTGFSMVALPLQGLMLACGGYNAAFMALASCELYNDVAGSWGNFDAGVWWAQGSASWAAAAPMPSARASFAMAYAAPATPGPRVAAVGGEGPGGALIDLYNPATGAWNFAVGLPSSRAYLTATTFPNDPNVIAIVGGQEPPPGGGRLQNVIFYRFSLNTAPIVSNMSVQRALHQATPLTIGTLAGNILVTGGLSDTTPVPNAELIAPTGVVTAAGNMLAPGRLYAATFELPTGQVRIAGGIIDTSTDQSYSHSELYTQGAGFGDLKFFPGSAQGGGWGTYGVLQNGHLLVAGSADSTQVGHSSRATFIYDGTSWSGDGGMAVPRRGIPGGRTPSGRIIATGGYDNSFGVLRRTELFDLLPNGSVCSGPGLCQSQQCIDGVCCNTSCTGNCDACNLASTLGTCTPQPNTAVCRPVAPGGCDVAENCTGSSATCPVDGFATNTAICRMSVDTCDLAETCPGNSITCPADVVRPNGTVCRPDAGACDITELCNGSSGACPADTFLSSGTCRGANGVCDVAESCNGAQAACPTDAFNSGMTCRVAAGLCDVTESCSGLSASCPADGVATTTVTCRGAQGTCDVVEQCSGTSTSCGNDVLFPSGTVCNQTYLCTGTDAGCPTTCTLDTDCATGSRCVGGVCIGTLDAGVPCVQNGQCASQFCVEGVCCNSACSGSCDTCALAGSVGSCQPFPQGSAGAPVCDPFVCDGVSAVCPTVCTNSTQCKAGLQCQGGRCLPVSPNGAMCTTDAQCASGFCTDGVCCNARCEGGCQACDVAGAVGTCTIAGRGELGTPSCAPFTCDGRSGACPTSCEADADCGPPAFCENKVCSNRTRGHVGFGCAGCSAVDGASLLGLLGAALLLRRRAGGR